MEENINKSVDDNEMLINAYRSSMGVSNFYNALKGACMIRQRASELGNGKPDAIDVNNAFNQIGFYCFNNVVLPGDGTDLEKQHKFYETVESFHNFEELIKDKENETNHRGTLIPALKREMFKDINADVKSILITEGEAFVPSIGELVSTRTHCNFTITAEHENAWAFHEALDRYKNVQIIDTSIYKRDFITQKFDLILAVPVFGGRELSEKSDFLCREYDLIALENLLAYLTEKGQLTIVIPSRITFSHSSEIKALRDLIEGSYKLEEISELPSAAINGTSMTTDLLRIGQGHTEDVLVKKYSINTANQKDDDPDLMADEDVLAFKDEIDQLGDWNVSKIFSMELGDDWQKFHNSNLPKVKLTDVATVIRGRAIPANKKNEYGNVCLVNISDLGEYEVDTSNLMKIELESERFEQFYLKDDDLLIPARGSVLRTAVFKEIDQPCIASSNIIVIRTDKSKMDPIYLKIFLDSEIGQTMLQSLQQGYSLINLSYRDLKLMEVPMPGIEKQNTVAAKYLEGYELYKGTIEAATKAWKEVVKESEKSIS